MRIIVTPLLILVVSVAPLRAQTQPEAVMVDEFGAITCEDLLSRLDAFAADLAADPRSTAAIVINPPGVRPQAAVTRRLFVSSTLQLRDVGRDRFVIYKGRPGDEIRTQFWKVPPGAAVPVTNVGVWDEEQPEVSRPFVFGYEDELGVCPTFVPKAFAKLILDNPGSKGHIVVAYAPEGASINKYYFAGEWVKELVQKQGVPRSRLRLFFTRQTIGSLTTVEFWFVPARKR